MADREYADPPLWDVIDALASVEAEGVLASRVAKAILTRSGYPGAYRAIGRAIAAGYVDYRSPGGLSMASGRLLLSLSDRGRRRWACGSSWARDVVGAWKVAAAHASGNVPVYTMPGKW